MDGSAFLWCQLRKAFSNTVQISFFGGKILFCNEPVAIEVSEGEWSDRESQSRWRCVEVGKGVGAGWCGRRMEQMQEEGDWNVTV